MCWPIHRLLSGLLLDHVQTDFAISERLWEELACSILPVLEAKKHLLWEVVSIRHRKISTPSTLTFDGLFGLAMKEFPGSRFMCRRDCWALLQIWSNFASLFGYWSNLISRFNLFWCQSSFFYMELCIQGNFVFFQFCLLNWFSITGFTSGFVLQPRFCILLNLL